MKQSTIKRPMTEAARAAQREYYRKWYEEHREQRKQYRIDYWERKAREAAERDGSMSAAASEDQPAEAI